LHRRKAEVRIFDYVDRSAPMLLKMFEKRLRGYRGIGYARHEAPGLGLQPPPPEELTSSMTRRRYALSTMTSDAEDP